MPNCCASFAAASAAEISVPPAIVLLATIFWINVVKGVTTVEPAIGGSYYLIGRNNRGQEAPANIIHLDRAATRLNPLEGRVAAATFYSGDDSVDFAV